MCSGSEVVKIWKYMHVKIYRVMIFFKWLQRFFLIFSSFRYYISWNRLSCQVLSTYTLNIPYSSEIWPNETALLKIITSYNCWIWGHAVGAASQAPALGTVSLYLFFVGLFWSFRDRLIPSSSSQFSSSVSVFSLCHLPWSTTSLFLFTCYLHCLSGFLLLFEDSHTRLLFPVHCYYPSALLKSTCS